MHSIRMTLFLVVALALVAATTHAQTVNVYGVNSSAFPKITADYVAFDAAGNPITDLTAADFSIIETPQGGASTNLTATLTQKCIDQNTDPEASIIIVLDRSQSMSDVVDGKQRWETAKDAVRAFVNRIKFTGETRVSLVSFAGNYQLINEWVNNAQPILDSLRTLQWQTVTNYVLPFEAPGNNIYELFKKRPANIPKYCFFLTDGHPNPAIPNEIKFVNDNSQLLQAQGIRFFSVTIKESFTHWTLESLAKASGGKAIVTDEKGIVDLFSYLALETQITKVCQISWVSPYTCNEQGRNRTALITLLRGANPKSTVQYLTPATSVAKVDVSDPVLFCGDPPANNSSFANVTITAQNATFAATAFTITPSTYFKVVDWNYPMNQATFTPFNLAPNAKRVIRVQFTQGAARAFRQAQLSFTGSPCPPNVTLVGGTGLILLQSPIGG
ncbi:MAG TPA: vWA domain-containing protein, partial [Candidatus Didemnitutus sp.]|nr:vWA domain-containing protein [Candidatus Didemnitutus sp.]